MSDDFDVMADGIPLTDQQLNLLASDIADWIGTSGYDAIVLSQEAILRALPVFLRDALADEDRGRSIDLYVSLKPGDADPFPETGDECGAAFFDSSAVEHLCCRPAHPGHWAHIACRAAVTAVSDYEAG